MHVHSTSELNTTRHQMESLCYHSYVRRGRGLRAEACNSLAWMNHVCGQIQWSNRLRQATSLYTKCGLYSESEED